MEGMWLISVGVGMPVSAEVRCIVGMVRIVLISYEKTWRSLVIVNRIAMEVAPNTAVGELGYRSPGFGENIQLVDVGLLCFDLDTARGTQWGDVDIVVRGPGTLAGSLDTVARDTGRVLRVNVVRDPDRTLLVNLVRDLENFERSRTQLAIPPRQRPLLKDGSQH